MRTGWGTVEARGGAAMMNPNSYWEDQAGYLIRAVRRALGDYATSRDVLAAVEDPERLAELAWENRDVRDNLHEGGPGQEVFRVMAAHLLRDEIRGEENEPGFWEGRANGLISAVAEAFPDRAPLDVLEDPAASHLLRAYVPGHYDGGRDAETARYTALRLMRRYEARRRR